MPKDKSLKELELDWYAKLEDSGFNDIENHKLSNRPLISWHSFDIPSEKFQLIQANRSPYQNQIDEFLFHPAFDEACKAMVTHGNSKFTHEQIRLIWELHTLGLTTRKIAKELGRVKSRIDDVIKGLRTWMNLL